MGVQSIRMGSDHRWTYSGYIIYGYNGIYVRCGTKQHCVLWGWVPDFFFEPQIPSDSVSRVPFRGYTHFGTKDVEWRLRDSL